MNDFVRINKYDVIRLENDGQYGWTLKLGYESKDGDFKVKFCKREFGKGNEKTVPLSIPLGENPSDVLKTLLSQIEGSGSQNETEDVPF